VKIKLKALKKKCDKLVSLVVRLSEADKNGMVKCYTCGAKIPYKEANAGHFKHNKLDLDLRNRRVQCVRCNKWLSGNLGTFALKLVKEKGIKWVDKLILDANTKGNLYTYDEVEKLIIKFKKQLSKLGGEK